MRCTGILLYVKDVDKSVQFYETVLKLSSTRIEPHFAIVHVDGGFEIYLHEEPDELPEHLGVLRDKNYRGVGTILHFTHGSVDECATHVRNCGYVVSASPIDQPFGRRQMYLYDPDGYNIVVEQPIT